MAIRAKFNKRLVVNMTDGIAEEVKRLADEQGVSNAEIIRQAMEVGLPFVRGDSIENTPIRD